MLVVRALLIAMAITNRCAVVLMVVGSRFLTVSKWLLSVGGRCDDAIALRLRGPVKRFRVLRQIRTNGSMASLPGGLHDYYGVCLEKVVQGAEELASG